MTQIEYKIGDIVKILNTEYCHKELINKILKIDRVKKIDIYDFNPTKSEYNIGFWNGKNFLTIPSNCVELINH